MDGGGALGFDALRPALFRLDGRGLDQPAPGGRCHHGLVCIGQQHQLVGRPLVVFAHAKFGGWRLGHACRGLRIGRCLKLGFVDGIGSRSGTLVRYTLTPKNAQAGLGSQAQRTQLNLF